MTLVDLDPKLESGRRLASVESRCASQIESAPAPAPVRPAGPELESSLGALREWARGPLGGVVMKAAGITLLMLGLGGIGAYALSHGLSPQLARADTPPARRSQPIAVTHAGLGDSAAAPPADAAASAAAPLTSDVKPSSAVTADGRVILNLATLEDLRKLPGVGAKRAEAILALRQKLGKFRRITDLLRIRGIGPRRLKQLQPRLLLDPPPDPPAPPPAASGSP